MAYFLNVCAPAPYAICFTIEELLHVRGWARHRELRLQILTDQVINGAEFEEMLIIGPAGRARRTLVLWRTQNALFAQTPQNRPQAFDTIASLLAAFRPATRARHAWLRRLGLAA
jgi:hypothetical protein